MKSSIDGVIEDSNTKPIECLLRREDKIGRLEMFGLFKKDPLKKLKKEYAELTEQAMQLQRNGDIAGYSQLTRKAEDTYKKIQELESQ